MVYYRWQNEQGWEDFKKKVFGRLAWPISKILSYIYRWCMV